MTMTDEQLEGMVNKAVLLEGGFRKHKNTMYRYLHHEEIRYVAVPGVKDAYVFDGRYPIKQTQVEMR